jgi:hypothetical protein
MPRKNVLISRVGDSRPRDWIDTNQLGRRNLTPHQASLLRGQRYNRTKKPHAGTGANQHEQRGQSGHSAKTADELAVQHGVSPRTMQRDGVFADAVDTLRDYLPDIDKRVMSGAIPPGPVRYLRPVCGRGPVGFFCCSCFFDCCCFLLLSLSFLPPLSPMGHYGLSPQISSPPHGGSTGYRQSRVRDSETKHEAFSDSHFP